MKGGVSLDQILPEKFLEFQFIEKIEEKKQKLEELMQGFQEHRAVSLRSMNFNLVLQIIMQEFEGQNILLYSPAFYILFSISKIPQQESELTEGKVKKVISVSSLKYRVKNTMDEDFLQIVSNFVKSDYINLRKLASFVMNEIKFNNNQNSKKFYLDWIKLQLPQFSLEGLRSPLRQSSLQLHRSPSKPKKNLSIVGFMKDNLKQIIEEEKKVSLKKILKETLEFLNHLPHQNVSQQAVLPNHSSSELSISLVRKQTSDAEIYHNPKKVFDQILSEVLLLISVDNS